LKRETCPADIVTESTSPADRSKELATLVRDYYEPSKARHGRRTTGAPETIAFDVLRHAQLDGPHENRQLTRVHLVVSVHLDGHVESAVEGSSEAGNHRPAHTSILLMAFDSDSRIGQRFGHPERVVRAGIVDDDDAAHPVWDTTHDGRQMATLVVRRQDYAIREVLARTSAYRSFQKRRTRGLSRLACP